MNMLIKLYFVFAKIGVCTFGGGYAMLPMLQRELADKRQWITDEELFDYYAVSGCTPGVIAVNTATLTGCKLKGIPGGIAATLGVVTPSLIIITALAALLSGIAENPVVMHALAGVRIAVCALVAVYIWKLLKKGVTDVFTLLIFVAALAISLFLPVSPVYIVAGACILGILSAFLLPSHKREGGK